MDEKRRIRAQIRLIRQKELGRSAFLNSIGPITETICAVLTQWTVVYVVSRFAKYTEKLQTTLSTTFKWHWRSLEWFASGRGCRRVAAENFWGIAKVWKF